ncbi:unnamed protein product [Protopolystoma xenopodis]|uniref:Uncharacterized protein n=1 Tax=Protopolystoma xenopodis TaxID=117903 RepID=A0A448WSN6_9PLAT|nr:unnamed protein product [Protopolystoma xenopodis]
MRKRSVITTLSAVSSARSARASELRSWCLRGPTTGSLWLLRWEEKCRQSDGFLQDQLTRPMMVWLYHRSTYRLVGIRPPRSQPDLTRALSRCSHVSIQSVARLSGGYQEPDWCGRRQGELYHASSHLTSLHSTPYHITPHHLHFYSVEL